MLVGISKQEAIRSLPYIKDAELRNAVTFAIWLIIDKSSPLKRSIDTAAKKYSVKPKVAIERMVRIAIPEEFFLSRVSSYRPSHGIKFDKSSANRIAKMKEVEQLNKKHIRDISSRL